MRSISGCVVVSSHCVWSEMIAMFYIQRVIITSQLYCHTVCLPEREDEVGRGVASLHLKWSPTAPWKCKHFFRDTFKLKEAFESYSKKKQVAEINVQSMFFEPRSTCFSVRMTLPSSWSSSPLMVTVKSMMEVRALISGV